MSLIEIRNLRKEFTPSVVPLKGVNADIEAGEVISIIGPSGTGKSTLLRCINRLETPTSGTVTVDGVNVCDPSADLAKVRRSMGMVFQSFNLFPHKMAVENIMAPLQSLLGYSAKDAYKEAMDQLRKVGLADKERHYPDELSGGQKQRVAIARALAMHPKILLFDEPTSALDPTRVSEVLSVIRDLAGSGLTMLIVTHEMRLARYVSDRVFFMNDGEIYEEGTPEQIFENPLREETRNFIFRIRYWNFTLSPTRQDLYEMSGSLEKFCKDQYLGRRQSTRCQLALEELIMSILLPAINRTDEGSFRLTLQAGEEGTSLRLIVDCSEFPDRKTVISDLTAKIPMDTDENLPEKPLPETPAAMPKLHPSRHLSKTGKSPEAAANTDQSIEAASIAILESLLRRVKEGEEERVIFRIL